MIQKIVILLCLLFCLYPHSNKAQDIENQIIEIYKNYRSENATEYAYLKTNQKIYYNGSALDFSLLILDQYLSPSILSEIAYLELIHEDEIFHEKYIYRLDSGMKNGHINLPRDIPTGNYQIVAYTHFMRNFIFEKHAYRLPIYIQNTADKAQQIVKGLDYSILKDEEEDDVETNFKIEIEEEASNLFVELSSESSKKGFYYLVSEGFQSLQFVAKVKLKKNYLNIRIPKSQLKGGFQKMILLDETKNVLAIKQFYFKPRKGQSSFEVESVNDGKVSVNFENNLISKVAIVDDESSIQNDPIDMFRRIYELFYHFPNQSKLIHLDFEQLTSQSTLDKYSRYSLNQWKNIVAPSKTDNMITFYPEKNIQIRGRIDGDDRLITEASLAIHFFNNGLETIVPFSRLGEFFLEVSLPIPNDSFHASILDEYGKDMSKHFKLEFHDEYMSEYKSSTDYYADALTDSLIEKENEFNYALSTFYGVRKSEPFFWENDNLIFDNVIKVQDYRGLKDFEEFIREAVESVSIARRNGEMLLNMIDPQGQKYDAPQLLILNNILLKNPKPLFDIPLQTIESLHITYDKSTLRQMGTSFVKGILVIKTIEPIDIDDEYIDHQLLRKFIGYSSKEIENLTAKDFSNSKLLELSSDKKVSKKIRVDPGDNLKFNVEMIDKKGSYYHISKVLKN